MIAQTARGMGFATPINVRRRKKFITLFGALSIGILINILPSKSAAAEPLIIPKDASECAVALFELAANKRLPEKSSYSAHYKEIDRLCGTACITLAAAAIIQAKFPNFLPQEKVPELVSAAARELERKNPSIDVENGLTGYEMELFIQALSEKMGSPDTLKATRIWDYDVKDADLETKDHFVILDMQVNFFDGVDAPHSILMPYSLQTKGIIFEPGTPHDPYEVTLEKKILGLSGYYVRNYRRGKAKIRSIVKIELPKL